MSKFDTLEARAAYFPCLFQKFSAETYAENLKKWEARQKAAKEQQLRDGKEPFDPERFCRLYLHDTGNCERLDPQDAPTMAHYERRYFDSDSKTVAEFADYLDRIESF